MITNGLHPPVERSEPDFILKFWLAAGPWAHKPCFTSIPVAYLEGEVANYQAMPRDELTLLAAGYAEACWADSMFAPEDDPLNPLGPDWDNDIWWAARHLAAIVLASDNRWFFAAANIASLTLDGVEV